MGEASKKSTKTVPSREDHVADVQQPLGLGLLEVCVVHDRAADGTPCTQILVRQQQAPHRIVAMCPTRTDASEIAMLSVELESMKRRVIEAERCMYRVLLARPSLDMSCVPRKAKREWLLMLREQEGPEAAAAATLMAQYMKDWRRKMPSAPKRSRREKEK